MKVYFLPYVAGMWRSMAPLYKEHKRNKDTVVVMPIPYWGRNADGELCYPHYDGYDFPVPVKDYHDVDLFAEHPDIIYFHNPYDDCNRVTSVDPMYYSDYLRRCCDKLIYTPYYTRCAGDFDLHSAMIGAVYKADAIVVWSEAQKEHYAAVHPGKEIIVKKRPKLAKRKVPEDWEERINGRRVVLLNNSLGALLDNPRRELHALEDAIRGNRDVCLWWRPHPLFVDTINSVCPKYGPFYYQIMTRFLQRNDIFDNSWDVERAAVRADEYLGDPSSVTLMFYEQGKKVTIL